jgi:hypothetical protein
VRAQKGKPKSEGKGKLHRGVKKKHEKDLPTHSEKTKEFLGRSSRHAKTYKLTDHEE